MGGSKRMTRREEEVLMAGDCERIWRENAELLAGLLDLTCHLCNRGLADPPGDRACPMCRRARAAIAMAQAARPDMPAGW